MSINRMMAQEDASKPHERVRDESGLISSQTRILLDDYLDTVAKTHKFEAYMVVLKNASFEEAARLSDRWQTEWIKGGDGGVFVYSAKEGKFCYTPTDETMELVGRSKLLDIFRDMDELNPESVDVGVVLPVQRILAAVEEAKLSKARQKTELAEAEIKLAEGEIDRWRIVAGIAGVFAVLGLAGTGSSFLLLRGRRERGSFPDQAYRRQGGRGRRRPRENGRGKSDRY